MSLSLLSVFVSLGRRMWVLGPSLKSRGRMCGHQVPSSSEPGERGAPFRRALHRVHCGWLWLIMRREVYQVFWLGGPSRALPLSGALPPRGVRIEFYFFGRLTREPYLKDQQADSTRLPYVEELLTPQRVRPGYSMGRSACP